ncbi:tetratricopeptide repeat protein [Aliisedimentitalea scapharcae]|uniref:Tetratricopeptide repeat protein n=1 Tax=Aliisedimentitalea scapharcae TaxID=1524259 RepID=A0ABZ2XRZ6_9RHOB|nr:tetratricopeptide repeat protein [Rhodobacteraceae bacterium M382]
MAWFRFAYAPLILSAVSASVVEAETCPPPPDHSQSVQGLIEQVQAADNEGDARVISNQMWEFWADAPNEQAQAILDRGMQKRAAFDLAGALQEFDILVDYCPEYAEGYNQRAFVNYLRQDFRTAVVDLDRALQLSPDHIAALSGKALSLYALGQLDAARDALGRALEMNPWLPERGLAAPGGPLAPKGTDL